MLRLGSHWAETDVLAWAVVFTWAQRTRLSSRAVGRIHFLAAVGLRFPLPSSGWPGTTLGSYWQLLALWPPQMFAFSPGRVGYISLTPSETGQGICFYRTPVTKPGPPS